MIVPVSVMNASSVVKEPGVRALEDGQVREEKFRMPNGKEDSVLHMRGVRGAVGQSR